MLDIKWPSLEDVVELDNGKKGVIKGLTLDGNGSFIYKVRVGRKFRNLRQYEFSLQGSSPIPDSDLSDDKCPVCQEVLDVGSWPFCPHEDTNNRNAQAFEPTVYDINAKGQIRFVMDKNAPSKKGYERRSLNTIREVRQFQNKLNQEQSTKLKDSRYKELEYYSAKRKERRDDLRRASRNFSPLGRDFVEHVIAEGEKRESERTRTGEAGFYIGAFE